MQLATYQIKQLVFLDLEPRTISILHGWSGICSQSQLCSCLFSSVTLLKLIIIFIFLYLIVSPVLLCTLFQELCHMAVRWLYQPPVFSSHHLHLMQSCWIFQWIHCVPRSWTFFEISIFYYSSGTLCSLGFYFCLITHFFVSFAFLSTHPSSARKLYILGFRATISFHYFSTYFRGW